MTVIKMKSFEPKKLALIRILQILEKYSDSEHPIKHEKIVDWFGKDIRIEERQDGRFLVRLRASVNAMEYWAMQYMNAVEILAPIDLRERIQKNVQVANEKYKE